MPPILFPPHFLAIAVILAFAAGYFFAPRLSRFAARLRWLFIEYRLSDLLELSPDSVAMKASDDK